MPPRRRGGPDYRPPKRITEREYRRIVDDPSTAVVVVDPDARIVELNTAGEEMLGWSRDLLLGEDIVCIIPLRFRERHRAAFARYLATHQGRFVAGGAMRFPLLNARGSESDVTIELLAFSVGDPVGVPRDVLVGRLRPGAEEEPSGP